MLLVEAVVVVVVMVVYVNDLSLIMGNWIELGVKVCDGVYGTIQIVCCMLKQKNNT